MTTRHAIDLDHHTQTRKSGFGDHPNLAETLEIARPNLGQLYPQDYPHHEEADGGDDDELGEAIGIATVAKMLRCSTWTVRNKWVPQGLPHIRASRRGRMVFHRNRVNSWILKRQQKGGK